jgi:hypothetical protein
MMDVECWMVDWRSSFALRDYGGIREGKFWMLNVGWLAKMRNAKCEMRNAAVAVLLRAARLRRDKGRQILDFEFLVLG